MREGSFWRERLTRRHNYRRGKGLRKTWKETKPGRWSWDGRLRVFVCKRACLRNQMPQDCMILLHFKSVIIHLFSQPAAIGQRPVKSQADWATKFRDNCPSAPTDNEEFLTDLYFWWFGLWNKPEENPHRHMGNLHKEKPQAWNRTFNLSTASNFLYFIVFCPNNKNPLPTCFPCSSWSPAKDALYQRATISMCEIPKRSLALLKLPSRLTSFVLWLNPSQGGDAHLHCNDLNIFH